MKIALAKQIVEDHTINIDNLKIFALKEIVELKDNLEIIYLLNEIQCYFSILDLNFTEFKEQLNSESLELIDKSDSPLIPNEELLNKILINLNRLLLNYLSSYRMMIDHIPMRLNEEKRTRLKAFISEIFDKNFEYRFCDQLRNFAQHKNFPITDFSCEADIAFAQVFYFINIENLLSQNYDWRAETKKEMKNYNKIDSLAIISSHYELIKKIRVFIFDFFKEEFIKASNYFENIENIFSGNYKLILLYNDEDTENLPISMINMLKKDFC